MQLRPAWLGYLLLPLLHFASVKLTFSLALSPEHEVIVWLPNAVLLAALVYRQGRRGWLLAMLTFSSDVLATLPVFAPTHAIALSLCNLLEVTTAYLLMRHLGVASRLDRIRDFGKFVLVGPVFGALGGGLLAGGVLLTLDNNTASYPALVLLWWYGDALGLLIYTPLLLAFLQPGPARIKLHWWDGLTIAALLVLAVLVFTREGADLGSGVQLTPTVFLPFVLFIAVRFGTRWTALSIALLALGTAWAQNTGHQPFGNASPHAMILRTQEFILTMSIVGMGFAMLFGEQKAMTLELEDKVREATKPLEVLNRSLLALSATDGLTGVANRRHFDEILIAESARARSSGESLALALVDVDLFKRYNDEYGHQAGDDALRLISSVLVDSIRGSRDLVARYGGEEFAIILPGADVGIALETAWAVCQALEAKRLPHAESPFGVLTASIGVAALVPKGDGALDLLIKRADAALYDAKRRGRNQVAVHGDDVIATVSVE
jgi:diguanylate cyclase (GGDEF)-like protein